MLASEIEITNDLDGETYAELEANQQEQESLLHEKKHTQQDSSLSKEQKN